MPPKSKASQLKKTEKRVAASAASSGCASGSGQGRRVATELSISAQGIAKSSLVLPHASRAAKPLLGSDSTSPTPRTPLPSVAEPVNSSPEASETLPYGDTASEPKAAAPSQTTALLSEFEACIPQLLDLLFGAMIRTAGLLELCNPCPHSTVDDSGKAIDMTLVTVNGIHRTRVRFCTCKGIPDRMSQLMSAGFFPATVKTPRTAFSFAVLDQFHRVQLECKASAYDFCSTLRRATDDAFTSKVPDIFPQFVVVMHVWRLITAVKRLGQAHGIDDLLSHRRAGNLIVHCPLCPEPHFNLEEAWREIPELLKHLCQLQLTGDGNHQANRYNKNTDPLSRSLFAGRGHFPTHEILQGHLQHTEGDQAEKSTCKHLNAAEKQDRKKFKNMDITGVVNVQCSHVFIKSTVDLQLGERFTNMDLAYALTLSLTQCLDISDVSLRHITARDLVFSYDIACGYLVKLLERLGKCFPNLVAAAAKTRGMIPAVHIQNHQDNCMYTYSGAYLPNVGHFHGETAEQYWVEHNQIGASARQMNNGHRQDVIVDHHNWWGWEKTKQMDETTANDTVHARDTYQQHKHRFTSLCHLYVDKLALWNTYDRTSHTKRGKDVESVYRHSTSTKGMSPFPSQKAILDALLNSRTTTKSSSAASDAASESAIFINEGIAIQASQRDLSLKMAACDAHSTATLEKEIKLETKKLRERLEVWRVQQQVFMPQVSADVLRQVAESPGVCEEELFLPSHYDSARRTTLSLHSLASIESQLREGYAFDTITSIQQFVKCLDALKFDKRSNCKGQDQNTRANVQISRVMSDRRAWIDHYNANRDALISLGHPLTSRSFPPMTVEDTQRTSVTAKRVLGASRQFDGKLWSRSFGAPAAVPTTQLVDSYSPLPISADVSTQGAHKATRTLKRKATEELPPVEHNGDSTRAARDDAEKVASLADGWIWRLGSIGNLTTAEIQQWEEEGDRVHWFRAEAEMERWREQWEIKLIEFIRCIKSFTTMADTWSSLAEKSTSASREFYARKKAAVYRQLCFQVESAFATIQAGEPTQYQRGEDIVEYIIRHRKTEIGSFHPKYDVQLFHVFQ